MPQNQKISAVADYDPSGEKVKNKESQKTTGKDHKLRLRGFRLHLRNVEIDRLTLKKILVCDPRVLGRSEELEDWANQEKLPEGVQEFQLMSSSSTGSETGSGLLFHDLEVEGINIGEASLQHPPDPDEDPDDVKE